MNLLDLIFPKKCVNCGKFGNYICQNCRKKIQIFDLPLCPVCQRQAIGGKTHPGCSGKFKLDGLVAGAKYRGPIKLAISKIKYRWVFDIGEVVCDLISQNLWRFDFPSEVTLMPIPLHKKRENWRGFNQAELLCKILSRKFKVPVSSSLVRVIETKTQVGLTRIQRKNNIRDAFALRQEEGKSKADFRNKAIILVDDVYTTGATMQEACKVLKKAGASKVWAMVVAVG